MTLLREAMESFLEHRRLRGLSPETRACYRRWLTSWQSWRTRNEAGGAVKDVTIECFRAYMAYLRDDHVLHTGNPYGPRVRKQGYAPHSIDAAYRALRAFWIWCEAEDLLTLTQTRFFARGRIPRPRIADTPRPAAEHDLVDALLEATAHEDRAERRALMRVVILLLYESGIRVTEMCSLTDDDVNIADRAARVLGKGGRIGWVFWDERCAAALATYLQLRRGEQGGRLLRGCSYRNNGGPLTKNAVRGMIKRVAELGGLELPKSAPVHCFRHGFVHAALDADLDLSEVSQLARHRNIQTTMIYARRHRARLQQAHQRIWQRPRVKREPPSE